MTAKSLADGDRVPVRHTGGSDADPEEVSDE